MSVHRKYIKKQATALTFAYTRAIEMALSIETVINREILGTRRILIPLSKNVTNSFFIAYRTSGNCRTKWPTLHLRSSSTSDGDAHRRRRWYMQVLIPFPVVRVVNAATSHVRLIYSTTLAYSLSFFSLSLFASLPVPSLSASIYVCVFVRLSVSDFVSVHVPFLRLSLCLPRRVPRDSIDAPENSVKLCQVVSGRDGSLYRHVLVVPCFLLEIGLHRTLLHGLRCVVPLLITLFAIYTRITRCTEFWSRNTSTGGTWFIMRLYLGGIDREDV